MQAKVISKLHYYKWTKISKSIQKTKIPNWYSTCPAGLKVTLCGAGGNTGQPLSLLLKQCHQLDHLALYDLHKTSVIELNQVDTKCKAVSYFGRHMLRDALENSNIVVIMAKNQSDSLKNNAPVVIELANQICNVCPTAIIIIATEPVQSMLPIVAEVQKVRGMYNPRALLGCVELHQARASSTLARLLKVPDEEVQVTCIGGASTDTLVPLLESAVYPGEKLEHNQIEYVTSLIMSQPAATTATSTSLVGAYTLAKTISSVVRALQGDRGLLQMMFADQMMGQREHQWHYFSSEMQLGPSGIEHSRMPPLSEFERCLLNKVMPLVQTQIIEAAQYVHRVRRVAPCRPQACPPLAGPPPPPSPPAPWSLPRHGNHFLNKICQELTRKAVDQK